MEYTPTEQQALDMIGKTNFKNLSKRDMLNIIPKLGELRPSITKEIIAQFPELAKLIRSSMENYQRILENITINDSESLKQIYIVAENAMNTLADNRKQFYDISKTIITDFSKCLNNPNLTDAQREYILLQEKEILKVASDKDTEIRSRETEIVKMIDKKDSEKRQFNWGVITTASTVLIVVLGFATRALFSNSNFGFSRRR